MTVGAVVTVAHCLAVGTGCVCVELDCLVLVGDGVDGVVSEIDLIGVCLHGLRLRLRFRLITAAVERVDHCLYGR